MYLAHTEFFNLFKDWNRECNQYSLHYEYVLKLGNATLILHELLILRPLYYTLPGSSASAERSFSS